MLLFFCSLFIRSRMPQIAQPILGIALVVLMASVTIAQESPRPATEDLLPETTVGYIQIDNVQETIPKTFGQDFLEDENVAPFLNRMYEAVETAYSENAQDDVGMSLEQIRDLPTGEMTIALIAPRRKGLHYLVAIDIDPESESTQAAADSMGKAIDMGKTEGTEIETETTEDEIEIRSVAVETDDLGVENVSWFLRDGLLVCCTSKPELLAILERWEGREVKKVRPLSQNRKFITIMNRCRDKGDVQPEFRFFFDPLSLARAALKGNAGALAAMNFLPALGLDGVLGFGGAAMLDQGEYKGVYHAHLLLANPRAGVLKLLALKPGEAEPQPFVPAESILYSSTNWDPKQALVELEKLVNTIGGDKERFERDIVNGFNKEFDGRLGFREDLIGSLSGRITGLQWSDPDGPVVINQTCQAAAIGVEDVEKAEKVIETLIAKFREEQAKRDRDDPLQEVDHEGVRLWYAQEPEREKIEERMGIGMRPPQFCFGIVDDSVILSDSLGMVKRMVDVSQGRSPALIDDTDYAEKMLTMLNAAGSDVPCMVMWSNPEYAVRDMIELVNDDGAKEFVESMSEFAPFLLTFKDALEDQPMPTYEDIEKYIRPSGSIVTVDDTGYHFLGFQYNTKED